MILTDYVMYFIAIGLGIGLIFIIYMMATKRIYTKNLLIIWFVLTFAFFVYSLSIQFIDKSPECVEQFKSVASASKEFVFKIINYEIK